MISQQTILSENKTYWTGRAPGYSELNRAELTTGQREKWSACLHSEISKHFSGRTPDSLHVLEVGTGPGFFAIILTEIGYRVTAIDLTPNMLREAKKNAGSLTGKINWMEMNAEALSFADASFDIVVSRNLTWNLPNPEQAYAEWTRVLKPGGLLLNFDANWYHYLFDDKARAAYVRDRQNTAERGLKDANIGENFDVMEDIARRIPLSHRIRPAWDIQVLSGFGFLTASDEQVWQKVWSEKEKVNFASTPLFLIRAAK